MKRSQGDPDETKITRNKFMIEENPCLSQKKIAQTLSLHHDIVKRSIIEEENMRQENLKWVAYTPTVS
jgi:hypothetical protein